MMISPKKVASALVLIFIFTSMPLSFASCGGGANAGKDAPPAAGTSLAQGTTADFYDISYLPSRDYGGSAFTMITYGDAISGSNMYIADSETGEPVNDALYKRNQQVEDQFNVKLACQQYDWGISPTMVKKSVQAGDHAYDLYCMHPVESALTFLNSGYLYNWNDMPVIDLSKPWYDQTARQFLDIGGYLPMIVSDLNYGSYPFTFAMIYNKTLAQNYALPDMYSLVDSGQWTMDKLDEYSMLVSKDLNGDGKYDQNDQYGLACDNNMQILGFQVAAGVQTVTLDPTSKQPTLSLDTPTALDMFNRVYNMIFQTNQVYLFTFNTP